MSGGFEDLGLLPELVKATQDLHWLLPSDVQDESIPLILGGGDVMVAAETGSGKTGAFALPALQLVHEIKRELEAKALESKKVGGGEVSVTPSAPPPCLLNANDRSAMVTLSPERLMAQCRHVKDWGGVRGTKGLLHGKAYYEVVMRDEGLCRVGWSSSASSLDLGTDRSGFGYGGTGKKSNDRKFEAYGEEFKQGDVIGCYLELGPGGAGSVSWSKNGKLLGEGFKLTKQVGALHPAVCMKNAELECNFGGTPFRHPPEVAHGWCGLQSLEGAGVISSRTAASGEGGGGGGDKKPGGGKRSRAAPYAIILAPARDLAEQTAKAVEQLGRYVVAPPVSQALLIGGMSGKFIKDQLAEGGDVTIATPGMLMHALDAKDMSLERVRLLILDEADRFAGEKENLEMINKLHRLILEATSSEAGSRLQVCFFSATLHSPEIASLADALCKNPTWVDLKGKDSVPDSVHHVIIPVDPRLDTSWASFKGKVPVDGIHKGDNTTACASSGSGGEAAAGVTLSDSLASAALKLLKPRMLVSLIDSLEMTQAIIFCRTNLDCDNLEEYLLSVGGGQKWRPGQEKGKENPYSCCVLAGMRGQDERRRNLEAFRDGDVRFLIATDVAARGIDIAELPYVVNMTLPDEPENYIHRIGRVGRADKVGLAVSLVAAGAKERVWFHKCANRGKGCGDVAKCSVWYDEPHLLASIRRRLQLPADAFLPVMKCTRNGSVASGKVLPYLFTLPPEVASLGAVYGEEAGSSTGAAGASTTLHAAQIRTAVEGLSAMEVKAQSLYLSIKERFQAK